MKGLQPGESAEDLTSLDTKMNKYKGHARVPLENCQPLQMGAAKSRGIDQLRLTSELYRGSIIFMWASLDFQADM